MPVIKSNAYGHGILESAAILGDAGASWFGVNSVEEGILLRGNGVTLPILILGYVPFSHLPVAIEHDLRMVVYNIETLEKIREHAERQGRSVPVHLKLETGTSRQGILYNDLNRFIKFFARIELSRKQGDSLY